KHDVIPRMSHDPKHRKVHPIPASGGLVAMQLEAPDRLKKDGTPKDLINVSFQLGVADNDISRLHNPDVKERMDVILEYIANNSFTKNGEQIYITKQQVVDHLREWAHEHNKPWAESTKEDLEGYKDPQFIYEVKGDMPQRIILAPVKLELEVGGVNPSWVAKA